MAERAKSSEKPDLTPDDAAPAPGEEPPDTIAIYGILGKSPVASSVRLFLDVGMSTYYDIPIEGIVKREKVPADQSPLGVDSSLLFVLKGVQLTVHHVQTRSVEEEFLSGDFTAPGSFTPTAAAGGVPSPGVGLPNTAATLCTQLGCGPNTAATVCTQFGPCQTRLGRCPTRIGPCPTRIPQQCGSALDACPSSLGCTFSGCHTEFQACGHTVATVCTLTCPRPSVQICDTLFTEFCGPKPSVQICPTLWTQIRCPLSAAPCPTVQGCA